MEVKMGGYGSTRWDYHTKKLIVEECLQISIFKFKKYLKPGLIASIEWKNNIFGIYDFNLIVIGSEHPSSIQISYYLGNHKKDEIKIKYSIQLSTSALSWGGVRYWFICPVIGCGRRVGVLYLPLGGKYFGCRHCYRLTYKSSQEQHMYEDVYRMLAASMSQGTNQYDWRDMKYLMENERLFSRNSFTWDYEKTKPRDRSNYLSRTQLIEQTGLSSESLISLENARLLVPDVEGLYRPKLAGWGKKLAYLLLNNGWSVGEIKQWSKERWSNSDPRKWPPDKSLTKLLQDDKSEGIKYD